MNLHMLSSDVVIRPEEPSAGGASCNRIPSYRRRHVEDIAGPQALVRSLLYLSGTLILGVFAGTMVVVRAGCRVQRSG